MLILLSAAAGIWEPAISHAGCTAAAVAADLADELPAAELLRWTRVRQLRQQLSVLCQQYAPGRVPPPLAFERWLMRCKLAEGASRTGVDRAAMFDPVMPVGAGGCEEGLVAELGRGSIPPVAAASIASALAEHSQHFAAELKGNRRSLPDPVCVCPLPGLHPFVHAERAAQGSAWWCVRLRASAGCYSRGGRGAVAQAQPGCLAEEQRAGKC